MAENEAIREVLIDQLTDIKGKESSIALAQRALFDLHPRVREQALKALQKRPVKEYRQVLLDGFSYPWPAVADNAAEAIVALKLQDTVPDLLAVLDKPEPTAPFKKPSKGTYVREMIKINHPRNCLLCHALSVNTEDKVRGQVPTTDQSLTPPYYGGTQGTFVRADVTYLKQDFSVPLSVQNPGMWPTAQRFDFLVRERPAKPVEIAAAKKAADGPPSQQKQAVFFSLRELTGQDPGPTAEDWKKLLLKREMKVTTWHSGFKSARALAVDGKGRAFVGDEGQILLKEGTAAPVAWLKGAGAVAGLALDRKGHLLAAQVKPEEIRRIDAESPKAEVLTARFKEKRFHHPLKLAADDKGGVYFTDGPAEGEKDMGRLYYVSAHGSVTRLAVELKRPRGLALSPDGKTLYVGSSINPEVMAYPVESAGLIGKGRLLGKITTPGGKGGSADLAVDGAGVVYLLNTSERTVEAISAEGAKAGSAKLFFTPVACAVGGAGNKTLFVLTGTALFTIDLNKPVPSATAKR
jgi:sugar lactone lactonase YvrE